MESLALHTDKYQLNMMYAHWKNGTHLKKCVFDLYFRGECVHGIGFAEITRYPSYPICGSRKRTSAFCGKKKNSTMKHSYKR